MEALTVLLTVLVGVLLLLLGRWLYRNPRKMFPTWGLLNPEHPIVQKLGRVYEVFFIFSGIFASVAVSFSFLLRSAPGLAVLAFPIGIAGAWFLRPKTPQSELPVDVAKEQPRKQPPLSKHWKRYLAITACFAVLLFIGVSLTLGDSDVGKMALAAAESNRSSSNGLETASNGVSSRLEVLRSMAHQVTQTLKSQSEVQAVGRQSTQLPKRAQVSGSSRRSM